MALPGRLLEREKGMKRFGGGRGDSMSGTAERPALQRPFSPPLSCSSGGRSSFAALSFQPLTAH